MYRYKCEQCGVEIAFERFNLGGYEHPDGEEMLWDHIQMAHESIFDEIQDWSTPLMIECCYKDMEERYYDDRIGCCNEDLHQELVNDVKEMLLRSISDEYVPQIMKRIGDSIVENVMDTSAYYEDGCYSDDDIRLAIGRILLDYLAQ